MLATILLIVFPTNIESLEQAKILFDRDTSGLFGRIVNVIIF